MKLIAKQLETMATATRRITSRAGFPRRAFALLGVFALFAATTSARAACGDPGRSADHVTLPSQSQSASASDSIVGLWHVIYSLSPTVVFNESFDTWHSDGTEYDNAYLPPSGKSVCEGVWKQIGPRTVRLHHVGWTFPRTDRPSLEPLRSMKPVHLPRTVKPKVAHPSSKRTTETDPSQALSSMERLLQLGLAWISGTCFPLNAVIGCALKCFRWPHLFTGTPGPNSAKDSPKLRKP